MKRLIFYICLIIVFLLLTFLEAQSQDDKIIKNSLPKMLGLNYSGMDFYFTVPPGFDDESGWQNVVKIYIISSVEARVTLALEESGYMVNVMTRPNEVKEFTLSSQEAQPYTKKSRASNIPEAIFPGKAIHITSTQPILVYCVARFEASADGFLVLPVSALGKEYIVAGWNVDPMFSSTFNYKLPNTTGIVAAYDDTKVMFKLGGNSSTKTAGGMLPGQYKEATLNAGDVWMFSTDADNADLSGSKISSNKPVAVVTGNMCANIPNGNQWCDYIAEMDLPTYTWGYNVFVPKIPNRKYSSIIRIFAKEDTTSFFKDGKKIGELKSAGGTEGNAFFTMRMVPQNETPRSIVISGDKPVNVTLYNTGVQEDGLSVESDPFEMALLPYENFMNIITFCTPGVNGGLGFTNNYVNLVYETDSTGEMPDDLEYGINVSGVYEWVKLKAMFPGADEKFSYSVDGRNFALKTITLPGNGVYKLRGQTLFAAYSFGFTSLDSYGFISGSSLNEFNLEVDTIPPLVQCTINCDGSAAGTVTDMPDNNNIRSNLALLVMSDTESYNYEFTYAPIIPGATRTTSWALKVIDQNRDAKATVSFYDRRGNDTTITINFKANLNVSVNPDFYDFGIFNKGDAIVSKQFSFKNNTTASPIFVENIKLQDGAKYFSLDLAGINLPFWLQPQDSIIFKVEFNPADYGSFKDTILVSDTCITFRLTPLTALVTKPGEPQIMVSDLSFGNIKIDSSVKKQITITNQGNAELKIDSIKGPTSQYFQITFTPVIIPASSQLNIDVTFKPKSQQVYNDVIWFYSNAPEDKVKNFSVLNGNGVIISDISDNNNDILVLYPNPSDKQVTIKLTGKDENILSVQLIDEKGCLVFEKSEIYSTEFNLNIELYPSGNYFVKLRTSKGNERIKKLSILK